MMNYMPFTTDVMICSTSKHLNFRRQLTDSGMWTLALATHYKLVDNVVKQKVN